MGENGILPSPVIDGYRNKCEFSIGLDGKGNTAIGFQMGAFKDGVLEIAEPSECQNVSKSAKIIVAAVQEFVKKSKLPLWDKKQSSGFWRLVQVSLNA